ncbi:MAG: signal recognition particle-docking protein FtsY [Firmicutes bacterium]|nr:signal recognition particle-docking protein FtsY [Bacillota bacterium]MCL1953979.1 signal recognition particle-docking protein FtsY [Bacillota bacterium]
MLFFGKKKKLEKEAKLKEEQAKQHSTQSVAIQQQEHVESDLNQHASQQQPKAIEQTEIEQQSKAIEQTEIVSKEQPKKKLGFFGKIKAALKKTKDSIGFKLNQLFKGSVLDDDFYDELEAILISSDMGVTATEEILEQLRSNINKNHIVSPEDCRAELQRIIQEMLERWEIPQVEYPVIVMVVGVNGVGKTTSLGKLAYRYKQSGKDTVLVAADTFRAAASSQLEIWAGRAGVRIIKHDEGADPGTVLYDAIASAKARNTQVLLVDTAGRLHNKKNLMEELKKINKVACNNMPNAQILTYIVLDATTGQNAITQVRAFDDIVNIDGIILTKLDGTAKGGVVVAISEELQKPVVMIGVGEGIGDLEDFDAKEFVAGIFE